MKKRLELFLAGITLFPIIFGSFSFVMLMIVVPMEQKGNWVRYSKVHLTKTSFTNKRLNRKKIGVKND